MVFEPLGLHRALERGEGLALEVGDLLCRAVLLHHHVTRPPAVGRGEVDHALTLRGHAEGGDEEVDLAPQQLRHSVFGSHAGKADLVLGAQGPQ